MRSNLVANELAFHDPADLPQASATDHPIDHALEALCPRCNHAVDAVCPDCQTPVESSGASSLTLAQLEIYETTIRRLLTLGLMARNVKLVFCAYLIAKGDAWADGISISDTAKRLGVTKATVSKHCRIICVQFGFEPSRYMLNEMAGQKFRESNRRPVKIA